MNKCIGCKVNIHPQHKSCPLCGRALGELPTQYETSYPAYVNKESDGFNLKKLFSFATIVFCAISIFINAFNIDKKLTLGSLIVSISLIYLWFIIHIALKKRFNIGKKMLYSYGITSVFTILLDICIGFSKWSTTYGVPFLTVAVAIVFTVLAVSSRNSYGEYLGFLIAIFFVSFCPIIIFVFSFSTQVWTSFVAMLYCLLAVAGLIIFSGANFKQEIKKRFHF